MRCCCAQKSHSYLASVSCDGCGHMSMALNVKFQLLGWALKSSCNLASVCTSRIISYHSTMSPLFSNSTWSSARYALNVPTMLCHLCFLQAVFFFWNAFLSLPCWLTPNCPWDRYNANTSSREPVPMFSHPFPEPFGHISDIVMITLHDTYGHLL